MISKGFLKSSIVYTIGGAMPMLTSILLLPFYANYLNEQNFLQINFYIIITLLFQIFFTSALDTYFGIKYTRLTGNELKQKEFIGTTAILMLGIAAFWLIVMAVSGHHLSKLVFKDEYEINFWPYGFYSVLTGFFNAYFKTASNALIYLKKPRIFVFFNVINLIATLFISIGGLFLFPDTIIGPMYGRLLSGVVIFALAHYIFLKFGTFKFDRELLPEIKKFCIPYLLFGLSVWVVNYIDGFMLQEYISETDLNTYQLVLKCFFGVEFIQNSLSAVIYPQLYAIWNKQGESRTTKESNRYFNVFTVVNILQLILFCIFIPLLYKLVIAKESFYDASAYIGVISTRYGLVSIINFYLSTILFSKNVFPLFKIYGITAVFQIIVTYFASVYFGLMGVIYAGIGTRLAQVILSALFTRNVFTYEFNYMKIYGIPLLFMVVNIVQYIFFPQYDVRLYLIQLLAFSIIFYLVFRNEIKQVLIQFKIRSA